MKRPFFCLVSKSVSMEATTNSSTNISFAVKGGREKKEGREEDEDEKAE